MRLVVQKVKKADVKVGGHCIGAINAGILIFLGIAHEDTAQDIDYMIRKILHLRMFEDHAGKMNLSVLQKEAEILVISQFTLLGDCSKGRRPSFDQAASPSYAEELYNLFVERLQKCPLKIATGQFRAMMEIGLVNDGPVTFILDSPVKK